VVAYALGRRIYAFGAPVGRWDVLELPEGVETSAPQGFGGRPSPSLTWDEDTVTFDHDGHLYVFTAATGKWRDIDTRAILDTPDEKAAEKTNKSR
jgi:hypothetical protein